MIFVLIFSLFPDWNTENYIRLVYHGIFAQKIDEMHDVDEDEALEPQDDQVNQDEDPIEIKKDDENENVGLGNDRLEEDSEKDEITVPIIENDEEDIQEEAEIQEEEEQDIIEKVDEFLNQQPIREIIPSNAVNEQDSNISEEEIPELIKRGISEDDKNKLDEILNS